MPAVKGLTVRGGSQGRLPQNRATGRSQGSCRAMACSARQRPRAQTPSVAITPRTWPASTDGRFSLYGGLAIISSHVFTACDQGLQTALGRSRKTMGSKPSGAQAMPLWGGSVDHNSNHIDAPRVRTKSVFLQTSDPGQALLDFF